MSDQTIGTHLVSLDAPPALTGSHRFLLIDKAGLPFHPLKDHLGGVPCAPAGWPDARQDLLPVLLEVDACDPAVLEWLSDVVMAQCQLQLADPLITVALCAFLSADVPVAELAAHIGSRLVIIDPLSPDNTRAFWRLYDPRVFAHLAAWVLRPEQCAALAGPVQAWTFAHFGQWYTLSSPQEVLRNQTGHWPDAAQWQHAQRIALINQAIAETPGLVTRDLAWVAHARHASAAMDFVQTQLHWAAVPEDHIALARHVLQQGLALADHPGLSRLLEHPAGPPLPADFAALLQWLAHEPVAPAPSSRPQ
ncbi:DUF4123 domain-containing protein [Amantichitinum ursilacus]|uniref:Uncharacterized protein n=1 Tax=Amantichitinum ursilacus TaxID=857265 RepID=A0A0N0XLY0_9NEIS|nr:DUF4123 domain-containing protein [Amantichitinum ursilacus]KPC54139.1 hypothetical protein WG78_05800 [Amantichitinum ursilacus]